MAEKTLPPELPNLTLVTGGARSGKSAFAERLATNTGRHVLYIATMHSGGADGESTARISKHRERRPGSWDTLEEAVLIAERIDKLENVESVCLIDCLSLWLANILPRIEDGLPDTELNSLEQIIAARALDLLRAIASKPSIQFILVTNEVGSGIVPTNVVARVYRDLLGTLNQTIAQRSNRAWLCCVGLQVSLKS